VLVDLTGGLLGVAHLLAALLLRKLTALATKVLRVVLILVHAEAVEATRAVVLHAVVGQVVYGAGDGVTALRLCLGLFAVDHVALRETLSLRNHPLVAQSQNIVALALLKHAVVHRTCVRRGKLDIL